MLSRSEFKREKNYEASIYIAKSLRQKRLITEREYRKIRTMLLRKYRPIFGGVFS